MKDNFTKYMETFNVNHVYRALIAQKNEEALTRYERAINPILNENGTPIKAENIENLVYRVSDVYMSVENDYKKIYDCPLNDKFFKQLVILKILASAIRRQKDGRFTQELLDSILIGENINTLVDMFGLSDNIQIKREDDVLHIDLGMYMHISTEGPGTIKYEVSKSTIEKAREGLLAIKI